MPSTQSSYAENGRVVAGVLAPHPPHLIYAENPPQNEPKSEGGWEVLRWGYERLRKILTPESYDVIIVHSPHWKTQLGTHILAYPHFTGLSVDPIFPHLFRFHYDLQCNVNLAERIHAFANKLELQTELMRNPDFRVDYGTIIACHLINPEWNRPIVALSSHQVFHSYSNEVGHDILTRLGLASRQAIEESGLRALVVASCSLSHRHFTHETELPEDMSQEHIYSHNQYLWDMRQLGHIRAGRNQQILQELPDFIECSTSEFKDGSFSWMASALGLTDRYPTLAGEVHSYGTVIGTGNAVVSWIPPREDRHNISESQKC